jgi:long-chain acyl-CoA synthetase
MTHPAFHAQTHPEKPAYIMAATGQSVTYRQLDERSNQVAQLLRAAGVQQGEHIAIWMKNTIDFMPILWGAQRAGLIYTAVSTYLSADEAAYIMENCDAKLVFACPALAERALAACQGNPRIEAIYVSDVDTDGGGLKSLPVALSAMPKTAIADEKAGIDMLYSSGTTGRPKGVMMPHTFSKISDKSPSLDNLIRVFGFDEHSVYLSPAPLYHAAPLRFNMMTMFQGGTSIIMDKFDARAALDCIAKYGVTHSQWVPTMFQRMLDIPEDERAAYDTSSMKVAIHAAAPCPVATKQAMMAWWGPVIYEYYSMSEALGATLVTPEQWLAKPGTVGQAISGDIRIVDDETGELCPTGEVGCIYFANGPSVSYHKDPEKTASIQNQQGWFTCGDMGFLDEEGYLYLSDRKDFMIISGGVNIYPQETEDLLQQHPDVFDAAVFGVPDPDFGQAVKAVVQLHLGVDADESKEEELIGFCRDRMSSIKCPRSIDFTESMPRMENGKLFKKLLIAEYNAAAVK